MKEALLAAREALEKLSCLGNGDRPGNSVGNVIAQEALAIIDAALAQTEQEPGFWLSAECIDDLVINSLKDLIRRAKQCSICDVDLREGGRNVRFEADWVKYMEWRDAAPVAHPNVVKDATAAAIERAAKELPEFYNITIEIERGYGGVRLSDPNSEVTAFEFDEGDDGLSDCISEAIDSAIAAAQKGADRV